MKLFSKPKNIGISRDKEAEKNNKALPSPNKMGIYGPSPLPNMFTASTTSLADSAASGPSTAMYSARNNSTATLTPATESNPASSDKHKHHFLSRQKLKLRDKDDSHQSSSATNPKAAFTSPSQPLYSFTPSSPAHGTATFSKTGLDLRHGGRALREKKREEKASAAAAAAAATTIGFSGMGYYNNARDEEAIYSMGEWPASFYIGGGPLAPIPAAQKSSSVSLASGVTGAMDTSMQVNLQGLGLAGMTPDDAWPFLKAKLLVIFEGEDMRLPVEDCNKLVLYV